MEKIGRNLGLLFRRERFQLFLQFLYAHVAGKRILAARRRGNYGRIRGVPPKNKTSAIAAPPNAAFSLRSPRAWRVLQPPRKQNTIPRISQSIRKLSTREDYVVANRKPSTKAPA